MPINYKPVGWDTTKFVNPTNMNQMEAGIQAACDAADELEQEVEAVNESLATKNLKTYTNLDQIGMSTENTIEEIMIALPTMSCLQMGVSSVASNFYSSMPAQTTGILMCYKGGVAARGYCTFMTTSGGSLYSNSFHNSALRGWEKVALNSDLTNFATGQGTAKTSSYFTLSSCDYIKKCGWCKVRGVFSCEKNASAFVSFCQNLPTNIWGNDYYNTAISDSGEVVRIKIETDGTIMALGGTAGATYRFSLVYPVE